LSKEICIR